MDVSGTIAQTVDIGNKTLRRVNSRIDRKTDYRAVLNVLLQESLRSSGAVDAVTYQFKPRTKRLSLLAAIVEGHAISPHEAAPNKSRGLPPQGIALPLWPEYKWMSEYPDHQAGDHNEGFPKQLGRWHRDRKHICCSWSALMAGTQPLGLLGIAFRQGAEEDESSADTGRELAQQMTLALQMAGASDTAKELAAAAAISHERRRIAGDLHDVLAYSFTAVLMQLEAAKELLTTQPGISLDCITRASTVAKDALRQSRQAVMQLQDKHPEPLIHSIPRLVAECEKGMKPYCSYSIKGDPRLLPAETERQMLRIAQEALGNAQRYANANHITLTLSFEPAAVVLGIVDDGIGFDPGEADGLGFGLSTMRKRADRIGGSLSIQSEKGAGTTVTSHWPEPKEKIVGARKSQKT